jgi:hypothetical protein
VVAMQQVTRFAARHPCAWHVTEAEGANCETLYPAAVLRCLAGLPADRANRDDFQHLTLPDGSSAILRPQLMPDARLEPVLAGAFAGQPDAWRDHINQHVFFWLQEDRRDSFISACVRFRARGASGPVPAPIVIELDMRRLLNAHCQTAFFSRINSGSTVRGGARARRDETTLCPLSSWRGERAVELAIRAPVPLPRLLLVATNVRQAAVSDSRFASNPHWRQRSSRT